MPQGTMYSNLSPGTYFQTLDLTARTELAISTTGAMVFEALRGTLKTNFTPTFAQWTDMYGAPNPAISFAGDCAQAFLKNSSNLFNQRVVNGALHAGTSYFKDTTSANAGADGRILTAKFPLGTTLGYEGGGRPFVTLSFSSAILADQTFSMTITDGDTEVDVTPVVYSSSHNTTMNLIASAISTAMADFGTDGQVVVYTEPLSLSTDNKYVILVYPPSSTSLLFLNEDVSGTGTLPTATISTTARLFDYIAENPGEWGDDVGVKLTNFDVGQRQRFRLTIAGPLITGNTIAVNINGTVVSQVFTTTSDNTLSLFAAAIAAHADIAEATVQVVAGASNNDRSINIIADQAGPAAVVLSGGVVTGGASQTGVLTQETLRGVVATNEFDVEIYSRSNVVVPAEVIRVTLGRFVNSSGSQTDITYRFNKVTTNNGWLRIIVPASTYADNFKFTPTLVDGVWTLDRTINWLGGGDDGAKVLNSQIRDGWTVFADRERRPVRILINAGYTDVAVQQRMVAVAEERHDAIAVLDAPSDMQRTQSIYEHRILNMNIDSSFGALYTPDLLIVDNDSDETRFIPPSGHVASAYAYTDKVAAAWKAPAGLNRGVLSEVQGLRYNYEQGDRELLHPVGVNCIINKGGRIVVYDEETLQLKKSVLSSVHARRLLNILISAYADALDTNTLFEPNNQFTRFNARQLGLSILKPIQAEGGLYWADVICDDSNNNNDVIDMDVLRVDMYLQIVRAAKRILLRAVLTRTGERAFSEAIAIVNNQAAA